MPTAIVSPARVFSIGLPRTDYQLFLRPEPLPQDIQAQIRSFFETRGLSRVVIFGRSATGKRLAEILAARCRGSIETPSLGQLKEGDYDAIVIATSPIHYDIVTTSILQHSIAPHVPIVTVFREDRLLSLGVSLETQPRSGTHYMIENLSRCLCLGYASTFNETDLVPAEDGILFIHPAHKQAKSFLVKTHFYAPLTAVPYRFVKTLHLMSYIFDSYYSWGKLHVRSGDKGYVLKASSAEWQFLRSFIDLNKQWLDYIKDRFVIRYEDYFSDFDRTILRLSSFLGNVSLDDFLPPRSNPERLYWSGNYLGRMDKEVLRVLSTEFSSQLEYFWPEKREDLTALKLSLER